MAATTADDVWRLLGELAEAQKETERKFQETEWLLKEQSQETERLLKAQSEETNRQLQAAIQENKRINRQVSKQLAELGGAWGRFVEDLVAPSCSGSLWSVAFQWSR